MDGVGGGEQAMGVDLQNTGFKASRAPLYTPEERRRRDTSPWTVVQGVLAPVQLLVCLVSIVLIERWFSTGEGLHWATASVLLKTLLLYAIMVTGAIWEREVFGRYLFAPAFFWEDAVSMVVIALHTAFLVVWAGGLLGERASMWLALAAYAAYLVNAAQFLVKLRAARREREEDADSAVSASEIALRRAEPSR